MKTFEEALDDIYDRAKERQIIERRRNKRLITLATTCATLSVVVMLSVVFVWRLLGDGKTPNDEVVFEDPNGDKNWTSQPSGAVDVLEGKNGDKKWITDIPGAVYIENPEYFDAENKNPAPSPLREVTLKFLKNSLVVIGDVENVKSFYITEGYDIWFITTFDIKISMDVHNSFETDTLKCVTSFRYFDYGTPATRCGLPDIGMEIIEDPSGAFVVKDVADDSWHWSGIYYNVSDYADYYVRWRYTYSSKGIIDRHGDLITFDEINGE